AEIGRAPQPGDQTPVLGHIVGRHPDRLADLDEDLTGSRLPDHGPVARGAGVTARATVGFHDHAKPLDPARVAACWTAHAPAPAAEATVTVPTPPCERGCAGTRRSARPRPAAPTEPGPARNRIA